jgi:hypothetical protein
MTRHLNQRFDIRPQSNGPRQVLFWILCSLMLAWAGCKHATTTSTDIDPVGAYTLVTVAGNTLPCAVAHEGSPTVKSGVFIINSDGTCSSKITFSTPTAGEMVREVKATYTREGPKLTMKWEGAGVTLGRVEGTSFTMDNEGTIFAYRK